MKAINKFLFSTSYVDRNSSKLLLAFRLLFGVLFLWHGIMKLASFGDLSAVFPDPLGFGSALSLSLVIVAEFFCALAFIAGFLFRLILIPMIIAMFVAVFVVHSGAIFGVGELPFIYLAVFVVTYFTGAGKYSVDYFVGYRKLQK